MKIESTLLSGAGNTFHLIDDQKDSAHLDKEGKRKLALEICQKNPADGVIFLKAQQADSNLYQWTFFNNDGSDAEMCGNATRCVGHYIKNVLKDGRHAWLLQTTAGKIKIQEQPGDQFRIEMTPILLLESKHGFYCNTGVPHLVLEINDFAAFRKLKESAKALRTDSEFGAAGTNVTYVFLTAEKNKVLAVSYERGVEDFTEACGTGAMAAAFYNFKKQGCVKTEVEMPGGSLMMDVSNPELPVMIGSAKQLGKYFYEA